MTDASKARPTRVYLATVAPAERATAERLCELLEDAYPKRRHQDLHRPTSMSASEMYSVMRELRGQ